MSNKRVNPFKLKLHLIECEADEKDKKISNLEAELKQCKEDAELIAMSNSGLANMVTKKDHQLALTEKALELACGHISAFSDSCYYCDDDWKQNCPCGHAWWSEGCEKNIKNCLLKQAEEIMKSE